MLFDALFPILRKGVAMTRAEDPETIVINFPKLLAQKLERLPKKGVLRIDRENSFNKAIQYRYHVLLCLPADANGVAQEFPMHTAFYMSYADNNSRLDCNLLAFLNTHGGAHWELLWDSIDRSLQSRALKPLTIEYPDSVELLAIMEAMSIAEAKHLHSIAIVLKVTKGSYTSITQMLFLNELITPEDIHDAWQEAVRPETFMDRGPLLF